MTQSSVYRKPAWLAVCFFLLAGFAGNATGQEPPSAQTIQVIGTSRIYKDNVAAARDQAIQEGLAAAVDKAVLGLLSTESLVRNFAGITEMLSGQTGTYVQGYKVLAEQRIRDVYRVLVQAEVSIAGLDQRFSEAGIVTGKAVMPAVLFLISEQNIDSEAPRYWWASDMAFYKAVSQTAMSGAMLQKGFRVVDPAAGSATPGAGGEADGPTMSDEQALLIGGRLGADVVVTGQARVEPTANVMGADIRSFRATVSVRALQTATGSEIASTRQTAVAANPNDFEGGREALAKAGALAGEAVSQQIASVWKKGSQEPAMVRILVDGTQNLSNFVLFRRVLSDIPGVEGIKIREMKADASTLMVGYAGTPKALADALILKTFDTFGININEVSESHLRIEIVSKP